MYKYFYTTKFNFDAFDVVSAVEKEYVFYDNFNNSLVANDIVCFFYENKLFFHSISTSLPLYETRVEKKEIYRPEFTKNLPKDLRIILKNRALISFLKLSFVEYTCNYYNVNFKIFDFGNVKLLEIDEKEKSLERYFLHQNFRYTSKNFWRFVLETLKQKPNFYSTKLSFENYTPNSNFGSFVKDLLSNLTSIILLNQNGIIGDWDAEFLHDFRVAIRKILVFLKNTKKFLPTYVDFFINIFELIIDNTNDLRNQDVFLANFKDFSEINGLNYDKYKDLIDNITQKRTISQKNVANFLESDAFIQTIDKWLEWISNLKVEEYSIVEVYEFVLHRIMKKLVRIFIDISPTMSYDKVHKLRIYLKHLRYNVEFFGFLYDKKTFDKFSQKLKKYQDFLGFISDMNFYTEFLSQSPHFTEDKPLFQKILAQNIELVPEVYQKIFRNLLKYSRAWK